MLMKLAGRDVRSAQVVGLCVNLAASEACAACGNFKATTVDAGHRPIPRSHCMKKLGLLDTSK